MNMLQSDKIMAEIDWENVSAKFLERAMQEYTVRKEEAEKILAEYPDEDFERMYYGVPVSFPRRKHAFKMAWEKTKNA